VISASPTGPVPGPAGFSGSDKLGRCAETSSWGVAGCLGVACAIPLLAIPLGVLQAFVIPFEEERLREIFGPTYAAYCTNVRRWV
jgi:protein-S-isoprenylcysteine O-methyltransferase Ste14